MPETARSNAAKHVIRAHAANLMGLFNFIVDIILQNNADFQKDAHSSHTRTGSMGMIATA
jgi:hypothetical protein